MASKLKKGKTAMDVTLVSWVLDETGSMEILKSQTVSGFNEFLASLKERKGNFQVALTRFNSAGIRHAKPVALADVPDLSDYRPTDNTPLYDAVWEAITAALKWQREQKTKAGVMVVVQTDGQENASRSRTRDEVVDLISALRKAGGEIMFLGVDVDLWDKEGLAKAANVGTVMVAGAQTAPAMRTAASVFSSYHFGGQTAVKAGLVSYSAALGSTLQGMDEEDDKKKTRKR